MMNDMAWGVSDVMTKIEITLYMMNWMLRGMGDTIYDIYMSKWWWLNYTWLVVREEDILKWDMDEDRKPIRCK